MEAVLADTSALGAFTCDFFPLLWAAFDTVLSGEMCRPSVRWTAVSLIGLEEEKDLPQGTFSVSVITLWRNVCLGRGHQPHEQI